MEDLNRVRKTGYSRFGIGLLLLSLVGVRCADAVDEALYETAVREFRDTKDRAFRLENGPLRAEDRDRFKGLRYYPPDTNYRVSALYSSNAIEDPDSLMVDLADSKGDRRRMIRSGSLTFSLPGISRVSHVLHVLRPSQTPDATPFISFHDPTNGGTTYGAGRYLDVTLPDSGETTTIDFNFAYNPYCAYNEDYSCPLVFELNILTIPIEAGERVSDVGH